MPDLHILYYLVPLSIAVSIGFIALYLKLGSSEKQNYTDKPELLIPPGPLLLFIIPMLFSYGVLLSFAFYFIPDYILACVFTTIVISVSFLLYRNLFLWVHLFTDKICISYPLQNIRYEIHTSQVIAAGYKVEGKTSHYFIQFEFNNEQKLIKIYNLLMSDWAFRNYFTSKNINYVKLN